MAAVDFQKAMQVIVPTSQRSLTSPASSLSHAVRPLLLNTLNQALEILRRSFPVALPSTVAADGPGVWVWTVVDTILSCTIENLFYKS